MGRPAPTFWWDFWYGTSQSPCGIVVQGDYEGGEALAVFEAPRNAPGLEPQIAQAEALIADFKAGRKTPAWGRAAPERV